MKFDAQGKLYPLQLAAPDIEEWLLKREPRAIGAWNELGREEYARAFTAARTIGSDVASDLYYAMVDNVARGGTEQTFRDMVVPILREKGWLGGDAAEIAKRVELIYDTNLRLARASGRWDRYQAARAALPYLRAFTVRDDRVRHPPKSPDSDHRAWDGIILPVDHDFWREYWPPLGFRCRCEVVQMTRSQLARYPGGVTSEAELEIRRARLGPPVFLAPGAGLSRQLAAAVQPANDRRIPGAMPIDPVRTAAAGRDVWDEALRATSLNDFGRRLAAMGF